ncbi:hypothetical protein [Streptomyces sp. NPDC086010]|uniref:hypothetical protein n=1 Tax=Streptomyces sp. NPDC086010 TaxID=3365745 RepID=UPI0037D5FADF
MPPAEVSRRRPTAGARRSPYEPDYLMHQNGQYVAIGVKSTYTPDRASPQAALEQPVRGQLA